MSEDIIKSDETAKATEDRYFNTLDLNTVEGKKATINAVNNAGSLKDLVEVPINITGIITTAGIRKGRGGLPDVPCQNTYLIIDTGDAFFSQSDGIARSANMIAAVFGAELKDGIAAKVAIKRLANGNTMKTIELL